MRSLKDDTTYNRFNSYKILYYSDRLKKIAKGQFPYPITWHIYPSNACPHNCNFCIMKKERDNPVMLSKETLLKAVEEAGKYEAKSIHFSGGGEPLTHPNILEAMKLAKSLGLKVILSTNGVLLNNKVAQACDHIRISLNAGTPESHKAIMQADTWSKILENIRDVKDKSKVGLGFVITDENWHEVYQFCEMADRLKVNFVHIRPAFLPDKDKIIHDLIPAIKRLTDKAKEDFESLNIYSVKDKFDGYWTERKYKKCLANLTNVVLKANSRFIPCQDRLDLEFGDYEKQPFNKIWGSIEHKALLDKIKLDECPRCVMTKSNEIIENIYINNNVIKELI